MACKACMWHRRGEAGLDLSPVKWKGCETAQHWPCVMTQEYVASTVDGAKLPLLLWQIPFSSVLAPFQTHWDGVCQLLQSGLDVGTYSDLKHFHSWQEAVKNKGVAGRGNVSPNWLAPWITEMPACQRVNHWSCLWCLLRSRTHQPAANVVFALMCFLSFSLSFRPVHVHAGFFSTGCLQLPYLVVWFLQQLLVKQGWVGQACRGEITKEWECKKGY